MMIRSEIAPILTLEYMTTEAENKYFDRKSARIKPSDLAEPISAFANASGGTIIIGIDDKTKALEGIKSVGPDKINEFINAPKMYCRPMPRFKEEYLTVTNEKGEEDQILLLHIFVCPYSVVRTTNESVFLRIGDRTKELKGEDLRNLEYTKGSRLYEKEPHPDAKIEDLDPDLIAQYKNVMGISHQSDIQALQNRGLIQEKNGQLHLTNAAVLLFAKNIGAFYPNCRVRFVRYDGTIPKPGTKINIIKDYSIELPLLKLIEQAKEFIGSQLREFTALNQKTGKFDTVPEYPVFAWQEGIVNAVTHREYGLVGSHILVSMYDDRLEIKSPGRLPNIVTVETIQNSRYSRNPTIARILTEMGWVRELNEGVPRIFTEMKEFFLDDPEYSEPDQNSVRLTLKNNIFMRTLRQASRIEGSIDPKIWNQLDDLEVSILTYMSTRKEVTRAELADITGKASRTIILRINRLLDFKVIKRNGRTTDPRQTYSLIYPDNS